MATFVERTLGGKTGEVVTFDPDLVIVNDGVSNAAVDDASSVAYPDRVMVIHDHDVPTGRPEAAAVLRKNLAFADAYGCRYVQAKGIGYDYLLHEVVKPGQVVVGGGSHASIFGATGALGINVSVPELSRLLETGRYSIVIPKTVVLDLTRSLLGEASAVDAGFAVLDAFGPQLARKAVEVHAPSLSHHETEVLLGIVGISGAFTASICEKVPGDALRLDLSQVVPLVMMPCESRGEQGRAPIKTRAELAGTPLHAGQIGGIAGGSIEDLRMAAEAIEGRKLALGFRLSICPSTSADYLAALDESLIATFIDYGAQINAAGDHSEVIQGAGAMGANEALITTGLYTYKGAMGVDSSIVYSASVRTVAEASCTARI